MGAYSVFIKCSVRYWMQHRWQAVLLLLGMALGVAVVFAVDIANESAKRAFAQSIDAVSGQTTHQLVAGANGVDEAAYTKLRTQLGFRNSAPVVTGTLRLSGETLEILGLDLFAEPAVRGNTGALSAGAATDTASTGTRNRTSLALLQPGTMLLTASTASRLGVATGDTVTVDVAKRQAKLTLIAAIDAQQSAAFESLVVMDIATAQDLLAMQGRLSRIDLVIEHEADIQRIQSALPELTLIDAARRNNALQQMTHAFHTNLQAMSLLALLIGTFLIYNTVTLSVLQRRSLFGLLRVAGVTRAELFRAILCEALVFAAIGTLLGLVLGYVLGDALLGLVTRTINDLYFTLDARRVEFSQWTVAKTVFMGFAAALIAALAPAMESANSAPVTVLQGSALERLSNKLVPYLSLLGVLLFLCGVFILWISERSLWVGFLALMCMVVGYSLQVPAVILAISNPAVSKLAGRFGSVLGQYPVRSLTASLSRTSIAIAALVVAVSATAGVGIMIGSFRLSVSTWLEQTLQSDIYIRAEESFHTALPENLIASIAAVEGVASVRTSRRVDVNTEESPVSLLAMSDDGEAASGFLFKQQTTTQANLDGNLWQTLQQSDAVFVSEPFAWHKQLNVGDSVNLMTDEGRKPFRVEGIFSDYTAARGLIVMDLERYRLHWHDQAITSLGVMLKPSADFQQSKQLLREALAKSSMSLLLRSNREIRAMSLDIFDRTFAITHVLRLLTVAVAFVAILSALMALALERRAEFAVLRAIGVTPIELRGLLFLQSGLMGLIAGVLALPLGYLMAKLLVNVINVRSFGWTMEFHVPIEILLQTVLLAVVAALLAGWYPASHLSQMSPAQALRHQ